MSESQQQVHGKQYQQKHGGQPQHDLQPHQHQSNKSNKDQTLPESQLGTSGGVSNQTIPSSLKSPPKKLNVHEMPNQDFINRLMAATPPYFYSPAIGNNFIFSDMLRSLVAARQSENMRQLQLQQQHQQQQQQAVLLARRSRKRVWSTQNRPYFDHLNESKEIDEKKQPVTKITPSTITTDKPLELTNKSYMQLANVYQRKLQLDNTNNEQQQRKIMLDQKDQPAMLSTESNMAETNNQTAVTVLEDVTDNTIQNTPPPASLPPQDLVLPPPPPVWYPPLYPPYVFDPLHFFIDLRVSGHIYDRKKDNISPLSNNTDNLNLNGGEPETFGNTGTSTLGLPNKQRHGSAFTVPTPRSSELKNLALSSDVLNLSANAAKYYDLTETKENNHPLNKNNTNYMLQQLPRLYSQFAAGSTVNDNVDAGSNNNDNISSITDNRSDCEGGDSDGRGSVDNSIDNLSTRDIDVEIVDSIKYRNDIDSSHCSSDTSITQIE